MQVKSRVKDKNLVAEKRRQIIDGAIKVFKKKGYHKATVREIAKEAGVGLGSIYDYFNSKDDILYLFFDNYANTFFAKVESWASHADDPAQRLENTYRAVLEALLELRDQVMLAYTQARYMKKNYLRSILQKEHEIVNHFQKIIEEIGPGPFDPFLEANFLVFTGVFGVLRRWILSPRYSETEIVDFLVRTQVRGFLNRIQQGARHLGGENEARRSKI